MSDPGASKSESKSVITKAGEIVETETDKEEIKRKATLLFLQGKRSVYIRDYEAALVALSESCLLFSQIYPELDDALADPYFYYGKVLLEVGRNESDVLGDQVKEDGDDEDDDDDGDGEGEGEGEGEGKGKGKGKGKGEGDGDGDDDVDDDDDDDDEDDDDDDDDDDDNRGEKNKLDGEAKEGNKLSVGCESEKNEISSNIQNGNSSVELDCKEKKSEKSQGGKSKENSEDEAGGVNDLQLSWEYLELAKLIYLKNADTCKDTAIKLAETYLCLGENGLESENYSTAIEDIKEALELQKKHLQPEDRRLAETYYQLGIAYSLGQNYDEAIECFKKAIEQLEKKISSLEMRKIIGDCKTEDEEKDAFYTMDGEINEIKIVIKDVEEKIKDLIESKSKVKAELLKQVCGNEQPSSSSTENSQSSFGPTSDITHLIKRKRKSEDVQTGEEKKLKTLSPVTQKKQTSGDTYCGADRGMFRWCQTISDLDVMLLLTPTIKSASDVKVETTAETILVQIKVSKTHWYTLMEDHFNDKIKPNEVVWTFEPGKLSIHIEKAQEKWWDSFLSQEPKINLQEIELTRPVSDLTDEEEMTLQKLWNDQLEKMCQIKSKS